ncbi:hypothetical protein JCM3775_001500 [Rhodotorula graminis]
MQVDQSAPVAAVEPPPPHSTTARRPHTVSYAFPGPSAPTTASQAYHTAQYTPRDADSSPRAGDFLVSRHGHGNFSFAPRPPARQPPHDSHHAHVDQYYVDDGRPRHALEAQPRSMALAASPGFVPPPSSSARVSSPALSGSAHAYSQPSYGQQYERAAQGGHAAVSEPMQRVVSTIQFLGGEYTPQREYSGSPAAEQPHVYQAPSQRPTSSRSAYTFGTASGPSTQPQRSQAQAHYPAAASGPALDWAKPRSGGMTAPAPGQQHQAVPGHSFAPAPGPSRAQLPPPPPPPHLSSSMRYHHGHAVYYSSSSYDPAEHMLRTQSNESAMTAYSTSTESSYASTGGPSSSHDHQRFVHPALARASGADSGYYGSPFMSRSSEFARSTSSSDAGGGLSGLRIAGALRASQGGPGLAGDLDDELLRASMGRGGPSGPKAPKRRAAPDIFHPPPQAMLAPGAYSPSGSAIGARRGSPYSPSYAASLPTDAEFAALPTKRSRGRRPPVQSDLVVEIEDDDDYSVSFEPSEAQIAWAGLTKTGKLRKIFLCKVPGCGKCFKRSEHLKRHVRSIHTNERPFQCQWPTCKRLFSRHDNLNQHLRIHREPGMSDADFSTALELYFGNRLAEVEREHSWCSKGESAVARKKRVQREALGEIEPAAGPREGGSGEGDAGPRRVEQQPLVMVDHERVFADGGEREEGEYRLGDDDDQDGLGATLVEGEVSPTGFDGDDNGPWAARRTSRSSVSDAGGGPGEAQVPEQAHEAAGLEAEMQRVAEPQPAPMRVPARMLALMREQPQQDGR